MSGQDYNASITLISSDKKEFVVTQRVAFMSDFIKQLLSSSSPFPSQIAIPDIDGEVLAKVIEFCKYAGFCFYEQVIITLTIQ